MANEANDESVAASVTVQAGERTIRIEGVPMTSKDSTPYESLVIEQPQPHELRLRHPKDMRIAGAVMTIGLMVVWFVLTVLIVVAIWHFGAAEALADRSWQALLGEALLLYFFVFSPVFAVMLFVIFPLMLPRDLKQKGFIRSQRSGWAGLLIPPLGIAGCAALTGQTVLDRAFWVEIGVVSVGGIVLVCGSAGLAVAPVCALQSLFDPCRICIDLEHGSIYFMCDLGWDARYPVSEMLAVQLIPAESKRGVRPYQLNLVCNNNEQPRLSLCSYPEQNAAQQIGQRIADFLKVPLVDQIPAERR